MVRKILATLSHTSQSGYNQGSYENSRSVWDNLSEHQRQIIIRNLARNYNSNDLSSEEQQNIRKILYTVVQGSRTNIGGPVVTVVKNRTSNTVYDENHNVVSHSESSTEYSLGHEGEAGSSYNNR